MPYELFVKLNISLYRSITPPPTNVACSHQHIGLGTGYDAASGGETTFL